MLIHTQNSWLLGERCAAVVRYMQDQPMCHVRDLHHGASFATRVAASIEVMSLSQKQIDALERDIARRRWIEPPRWRPYASVVPDQKYFDEVSNEWKTGDVYRIMVCSGVIDQESFNALRSARPDGMHAECTIGPVYETTRNVDDIRLERTPAEKRRGYVERYMTICRGLVNEARKRGMLIE